MRSIVSFIAAFLLVYTTQAQGPSQPGCMDPQASNYDPAAEVDNGSCCYLNAYTFSSTAFADLQAYGPDGSLSNFIFFPGTGTVCVGDGCVQVFVVNWSGEDIILNYRFNMEELQSIVIPAQANYNFSLSTEGTVSGCVDPSACNYNPAATCADNTCTYDCFGCTSEDALNFNPLASVDDGSCCFNASTYFTVQASGPLFISVTDEAGSNIAQVDYPNEQGFCFNGSCAGVYAASFGGEAISFTITAPNGNTFSEGNVEVGYYQGTASISGEVGCADPAACNYNPNVLCPDFQSCNYACYGCTDPNAPNYELGATIDDGSCCTNDDWMSFTSTRTGWLSISDFGFGAVHVNLYVEENVTANFCLPDGCYTLEFNPFNPSSEGSSITLAGSDGEIYVQLDASSSFLFTDFTKNGIVGCTNQNACNYDPLATCSVFNSCDYSCVGCTDSEADNYNAEATIDDGSCCYGQYTLETSGPTFWGFGGYSNYWNWQYGSTPTTSTFCPQNGCYYLNIHSESNEEITYSLIDPDGEVVASGVIQPWEGVDLYVDVNAISGCMDPQACDFNPDATCSVFNACDYSCYGCTNPEAPNYDSTATFDDGTCCTQNWYTVTADGNAYFYVYGFNDGLSSGGNYPEVNGFCMSDQCFTGYVYSWDFQPVSFTVTDPDGNVVATGTTNEVSASATFNVSNGEIFGCVDPSACNYDSNATCSDLASCDYSCLGCTDPTAPNFNPSTTIDNGTCCTSNWLTIQADGPLYWTAFNSAQGVYASGSFPEQSGFCSSGDCFIFQAWSWAGEELEYTISNQTGQAVYQGNTINSWFQTITVSLNEEDISGCLDPSACNYNPEATCDNGFCDYYCGGCTDTEAMNYNPNALWNDGSCYYTMEPPMIQVVPEESAALQDQYFVRVMVMETGNGAPYVATTNLGEQAMMIDENGQYVMGPFPCDQNVVVTMHSAAFGVTDFAVSDPVEAPCGIVQSVENQDELDILVYPNPASNVMFIAGFNGLAEKIMISDLTGRVVLEEQNKVLTNNTELNVEQLTNGVYNLTILGQGKVSNRVIVIKK